MKRNYGVDLLRIIAMFLIVVGHVLYHGGVFDAVSGVGFGTIWLLGSVSVCGVDCFALISGYVGYEETEGWWHYRKYIHLFLQVFFYSIVLSATVGLTNHAFSAKMLLKAAFPVTTSQYWYFTAYTGVFLLAPVINRLVRQYEDRNLIRFGALLAFLITYIGVAGILYDPLNMSGGYGFPWLLLLYTIGAYIKRVRLAEKVSQKKMLGVAVICVALTFMAKLIFPTHNILNTYTSPTAVILAITFLIIFSRLQISGVGVTLIRFFAPATFGVYLIHDNNSVRSVLITGRFVSIAGRYGWAVPFYVLLISITPVYKF